MDHYKFLNISDKSFVGQEIPKELFIQHGRLPQAEKKLFNDNIEKLRLVYCLKKKTTNIPSLINEERSYLEIQIIEVTLLRKDKLRKISETIFRAIDYPTLLILKKDDDMQLCAAHRKLDPHDIASSFIEDLVFTDWLNIKSDKLSFLDTKKMNRENFFTLYSSFVDAIHTLNISSVIPNCENITCPEARELYLRVNKLDEDIKSLKIMLSRESQFNRKMELNIQIKNLERKKDELIGEKNDETN